MTDYQFSHHTDLQTLIEQDKHTHLYSGIAALAGWDQETCLPPKAAAVRAKQLGALAELIHSEQIKPERNDLLKKVEEDCTNNPNNFTVTDKAFIRDSRRGYDQAIKLPAAFVRTLEEHTSVSLESWKQARTTADFSVWQQDLETFLTLTKQQTEYLGYKDSPYDALLDMYEVGLTKNTVAAVFDPLKVFTINLLQTISAKTTVDDSIIKRVFDTDTQRAFCTNIAERLGYDFKAGRLDPSTHPFSTSLGTKFDSRITTRYEEKDLLMAVGSTIHEVGHALYEQGVATSLDGTLLGSGVSLGIHESQSRLWENMVGKSPEFWQYWFPILCDMFPGVVQPSEQQEFIEAVNLVEPNPIRIESDEVTYNLHIILRYELEVALIHGDLHVKDVPEAWRAKVREYLGLELENDSQGVLQDIHWSMGSFGYFPTYTLGNLYAAQFWNTLETTIPAVKQQMEQGDFAPILEWLRTNIHSAGCVHYPADLCVNVTGSALQPVHLECYLTKKYAA